MAIWGLVGNYIKRLTPFALLAFAAGAGWWAWQVLETRKGRPFEERISDGLLVLVVALCITLAAIALAWMAYPAYRQFLRVRPMGAMIGAGIVLGGLMGAALGFLFWMERQRLATDFGNQFLAAKRQHESDIAELNARVANAGRFPALTARMAAIQEKLKAQELHFGRINASIKQTIEWVERTRLSTRPISTDEVNGGGPTEALKDSLQGYANDSMNIAIGVTMPVFRASEIVRHDTDQPGSHFVASENGQYLHAITKYVEAAEQIRDSLAVQTRKSHEELDGLRDAIEREQVRLAAEPSETKQGGR